MAAEDLDNFVVLPITPKSLQFLNVLFEGGTSRRALRILHVGRQALSDGQGSKSKLVLNLSDAAYLRDTLVSYANLKVREGTTNHAMAVRMAAALQDHIVTTEGRREDKSREALKKAADAEARAKVEAAQREEDSTNHLRDEMLRQVFLGGPRKRLNIWGNVVEEETPLSRDELRKQAKTTSSQNWRDALHEDYKENARREEQCQTFCRTMGKALKFDAPLRVKLAATPRIEPVDAEADLVLTGGDPMRFNEDMKAEGAKALLEEAWCYSSNIGKQDKTTGGVVVSTVSTFLSKPR